ncbi:hypothetical protein GQ457_17G007260 [Hibiscus cannabinus]
MLHRLNYLPFLKCYLFFGGSSWKNSSVLIVESDSSLCVKWLSNTCVAPSAFKNMIEDCITRCFGLKWLIEYVERLANGTTDKLAKSGITRPWPLVWKIPEVGACSSVM